MACNYCFPTRKMKIVISMISVMKGLPEHCIEIIVYLELS